MILSKEEILNEIKEGKLKIKPFKKSNLGAASIDLTLSDEFRFFKKPTKFIVSEKTDYKKYTQKIKGKITLKPNEFCLGITKETVKLPNNIFGMLGGRTRFARLGLMVHATASFIQPGINNKQIFEITNLSPNKLILKPGLRIAQLVLTRMEGHASYKGKYKFQKSV